MRPCWAISPQPLAIRRGLQPPPPVRRHGRRRDRAKPPRKRGTLPCHRLARQPTARNTSASALAGSSAPVSVFRAAPAWAFRNLNSGIKHCSEVTAYAILPNGARSGRRIMKNRDENGEHDPNGQHLGRFRRACTGVAYIVGGAGLGFLLGILLDLALNSSPVATLNRAAAWPGRWHLRRHPPHLLTLNDCGAKTQGRPGRSGRGRGDSGQAAAGGRRGSLRVLEFAAHRRPAEPVFTIGTRSPSPTPSSSPSSARWSSSSSSASPRATPASSPAAAERGGVDGPGPAQPL